MSAQGGVLHFTTELGGDASATDLLTVAGDASGTGLVEVTNDGGVGAQTVNGIKIIDVAGASDASFTLVGDNVFDGRPVVVAGAFAYSLWQNGVADPADGDWYLRSQSTDPARPAAGAAGGADLRGLSADAARAQRPADDAGAHRQPLLERRGQPAGARRRRPPRATRRCPRAASCEDRRAWVRVEGARVQPRSRTVDSVGTPDLRHGRLEAPGRDGPAASTRPTTACSSPA